MKLLKKYQCNMNVTNAYRNASGMRSSTNFVMRTAYFIIQSFVLRHSPLMLHDPFEQKDSRHESASRCPSRRKSATDVPEVERSSPIISSG